MKDTASIMKSEIRTIAKYRALLLSKYYLCMLFVFISFYLGIYRYPVSTLYILLTLTILPQIIEYILTVYSQKYDINILKSLVIEDFFLLSNLKKKYKFTKLRYNSNAATYVITIILICLWQINYYKTGFYPAYINKLPFITLVSGLTLRYFSVIVYKIKLPYDLRHNKV